MRSELRNLRKFPNGGRTSYKSALGWIALFFILVSAPSWGGSLPAGKKMIIIEPDEPLLKDVPATANRQPGILGEPEFVVRLNPYSDPAPDSLSHSE